MPKWPVEPASAAGASWPWRAGSAPPAPPPPSSARVTWEALLGGSAGAAGAMGSTTGRTLVLLTLYGGNDGLNTVIPYTDPNYRRYRPTLAIDESTIIPLGDGFGLHPSLSGLKELWDAKQLAIVQGVGFANPNYSHFESMDIWQSGVPDTPVSTGWLGRWLDATKASPLRAVGIGPTLPTALVGEKVQGAAIPAGPLVTPGIADRGRPLRGTGPPGPRGEPADGRDRELQRGPDDGEPLARAHPRSHRHLEPAAPPEQRVRCAGRGQRGGPGHRQRRRRAVERRRARGTAQHRGQPDPGRGPE